MKTRLSSIEPLEPRIAPASFLVVRTHAVQFAAAGGLAALFNISTDGKTATFTDLDGDIVSVAVSKGRLRSENFIRTTDQNTGRIHLDLLDLTALGQGARFQGASVTVSVVTPSGDSFGDLAGINARGIDLGRVIVTNGDLGQIDVGDANTATPALQLLQSLEMGFSGPAGQIAGQNTVSNIRGPVGAIVLNELLSAFIDVRGAIGSVSIGNVDATRDSADFNGSVRASGAIGSVKIGGAFTPDNLTGGAGDYSGVIWSRTRIGSVLVTGDIVGGAGFDSGSIFAGSPDSATAPFAQTIGPAVIYGSIIGGGGENSGTLYADSGVRNVTVAGSITGGGGKSSGALISGLGFASISIRGNLTGGAADNSGSIIAFSGDAPSIVIGGQIVAGNFANSGIFINGTIGTLSFGSAPDAGANATEIRALRGIGTINVFGDLNDVFVRAGSDIDGVDRTANASIGTVSITGNFDGGGLIAGGAAGADGTIFTADDVLFRPDRVSTILSRISTVIVGGTLNAFAIEAEQLGLILVGGSALGLTAGAHNDNFLRGTTVIKEIA